MDKKLEAQTSSATVEEDPFADDDDDSEVNTDDSDIEIDTSDLTVRLHHNFKHTVS